MEGIINQSYIIYCQRFHPLLSLHQLEHHLCPVPLHWLRPSSSSRVAREVEGFPLLGFVFTRIFSRLKSVVHESRWEWYRLYSSALSYRGTSFFTVLRPFLLVVSFIDEASCKLVRGSSLNLFLKPEIFHFRWYHFRYTQLRSTYYFPRSQTDNFPPFIILPGPSGKWDRTIRKRVVNGIFTGPTGMTLL